jgi:hypothetical protein
LAIPSDLNRCCPAKAEAFIPVTRERMIESTFGSVLLRKKPIPGSSRRGKVSSPGTFFGFAVEKPSPDDMVSICRMQTVFTGGNVSGVSNSGHRSRSFWSTPDRKPCCSALPINAERTLMVWKYSSSSSLWPPR